MLRGERVMATPVFTTVPCLMFVGSDADLADECGRAVPAMSLLRVGHAAGAVERMLVTRPLVVVVDESVPRAEIARLSEVARDIGAEVVQASNALRADLAVAVRTAILAAERNRNDPVRPGRLDPLG
ncbi:MAG TPA: hypothetical protein VIF09_17020 [Polyangiaceae bacterium]|jgi:hypothetical protein